jgi:hypothetical protein
VRLLRGGAVGGGVMKSLQGRVPPFLFQRRNETLRLPVSAASKACCWKKYISVCFVAVETLVKCNDSCFVAVETLVKRNDSQVASPIIWHANIQTSI